MGGWTLAFSWWVAGIPFDLAHCGFNFAIVLTLFPPLNKLFAHLQQQAAMKVPRRHVELYDTIMGCLGYTSPDGGINENNNWCRWKK